MAQGKISIPILLQARQLGYTGPFIGGNGFNTPAIAQQAGAAAEGMIVGAAWHITNPSPINTFFVDTYTAAYGANPDQFSAQAYTGAWLIATALRCANSADHAAVRDALAGISGFDSPLGSYSFDENRNPVHNPVVQIVCNGTFALLTAETPSCDALPAATPEPGA